MKDKKITYLLGAGASYQACPILKEQGEKMIEMAKKYLSDKEPNFEEIKPTSLDDKEGILWDIGYFGKRALEFGTIDTYAKKLHLSNDNERELQRLKLAVSVFFTLWESSNDDIKQRKTEDKPEKFKDIDPRYISLLSAILEKNKTNDPEIKDNIKFVTWNYDLQLERAYKTFCLNHLDWDYVSKWCRFRVNSENKNELNICHLNGYNGYYYLNDEPEKDKEHNTHGRTDSKSIDEILKTIDFTAKSVNRNQIKINDHINYAWETNRLAKTTRENAIKIFKETDVLIIIGYSFPPFNKDIDSLLFNELKDRKTEIYYQDINASEDFLKILTKGLNCEIHLIKDKVDHFYLPYDF